MLYMPEILTWFFFKILKDSHGEDKKLSSHLGISAPTPSAPLSQTKLLTAGGSPLPYFGARALPLRFGSRHFS